MTLFEQKTFVMHSGETSNFKIECDSLTDKDIETLALLISEKTKFREVHGVPTGGARLEAALKKYCQPTGDILIVDDVLTTGTSIEEARAKFPKESSVIGVVIFARGQCPDWVTPIFQMWQEKNMEENPVKLVNSDTALKTGIGKFDDGTTGILQDHLCNLLGVYNLDVVRKLMLKYKYTYADNGYFAWYIFSDKDEMQRLVMEATLLGLLAVPLNQRIADLKSQIAKTKTEIVDELMRNIVVENDRQV